MESVIIGIISGIIASLIFSIIMFAMSPRFIISDKMCRKTLQNGKTVHMIKVVNKTRSFITGIEYSLEYCEEGADGIKKLQVITPVEKQPIINIDKYTGKNTDYAVRLSYQIDDLTYPLGDNTYYVFTFQAHHTFSNAMKVKRVIYRSDSIQEGIFETGKSTKILLK